MLTALGHPQTNTPVKTDNETAAQFVKDTIKINAVSHGACGTIGLLNVKPIKTSIFIGTVEKIISPIITQNITVPPITKMRDKIIF